MTLQEIRELNSITYPEHEVGKDDMFQYVEEHKVNNKFTIVTGPAGCGKFTHYASKCDYSVNSQSIMDIADLLREVKFVPGPDMKNYPQINDTEFMKCVLNGGTVLFDVFYYLSDTTLEFLIDLTSKTEDTDKFYFSRVHPDFKIIGVMTPSKYYT